MKTHAKTIGIIGGVGPYAGLDLNRKIFEETRAVADQDHLTVLLYSAPSRIDDRTRFLLGKTKTNPAHALLAVLRELEKSGARVAGIPCNTAHSSRIFKVILKGLKKRRSRMTLLNMVEETGVFIRKNLPGIFRVGLLSTLGTYGSHVYSDALAPMGLEVIVPDKRTQRTVHASIYDKGYGIKAHANPVTPDARLNLLRAVAHLRGAGAEAVILGCTEIPLALTGRTAGTLPVVDPTRVLARALILAAAGPGRVKTNSFCSI